MINPITLKVTIIDFGHSVSQKETEAGIAHKLIYKGEASQVAPEAQDFPNNPSIEDMQSMDRYALGKLMWDILGIKSPSNIVAEQENSSAEEKINVIHFFRDSPVEFFDHFFKHSKTPSPELYFKKNLMTVIKRDPKFAKISQKKEFCNQLYNLYMKLTDFTPQNRISLNNAMKQLLLIKQLLQNTEYTAGRSAVSAVNADVQLSLGVSAAADETNGTDDTAIADESDGNKNCHDSDEDKHGYDNTSDIPSSGNMYTNDDNNEVRNITAPDAKRRKITNQRFIVSSTISTMVTTPSAAQTPTAINTAITPIMRPTPPPYNISQPLGMKDTFNTARSSLTNLFVAVAVSASIQAPDPTTPSANNSQTP